MIKRINSKQFSLVRQDVEKWFANQKVFFLVPLSMYLVFVLSNLDDGISLSDFVPSNTVVSSAVAYILGALLDLVRKWLGESQYIVKKQ